MATSWDAKKETLIIAALDDGPKHGYEISSFIDRTTSGFFSLSFGSLYPILHRLEKQGHVSATWCDGKSGKPKKTYRLTAKGKKQSQEDVVEFKSFIAAFCKLAGISV